MITVSFLGDLAGDFFNLDIGPSFDAFFPNHFIMDGDTSLLEPVDMATNVRCIAGDA